MSLFLYHLHDDILAYLLCKFLGQSLLLQQFNTIGHLKLLKTLFFGVLGLGLLHIIVIVWTYTFLLYGLNLQLPSSYTYFCYKEEEYQAATSELFVHKHNELTGSIVRVATSLGVFQASVRKVQAVFLFTRQTGMMHQGKY